MRDDLQHALRALLRAPGFSLLSLLSLICGLGFAIYSAAIYFSFMDGHIPFPEPERLRAVEATREAERTQANSVHYLDYLEYAGTASDRGWEALHALQTATITLGGSRNYPANFNAAYLPAGLWPWLGEAARPQLGRQLQASDEQAGAAPVVVIGAEVWRNFLAADPKVIGSHILVNGVDTEIVGVLPAALRFPMTQQVWLPFRPPTGTLSRGPGLSMGTAQHVMVLGRLKAGVSPAEAQAGLDQVAARLAQSFPANNKPVGAIALPYAAWGMPDLELISLGLSTAAALLLSLVCINTGNLLLARANERRQEIAVRAALGAPRARLIWRLLLEALLLCAAAGLIGLFFAAWALNATQQAVSATADGRMPFWIQIQLSPAAVACGLGLCLAVALLTAWLPAWRASALDVAAVLRDGRGGNSRQAGRASRALVLLQIALSSLLLLLSGVQSVQLEQRLNGGTGARSHEVMTAQLRPRLALYRGPAAEPALGQLWARLEAALREQLDGQAGGVALATSLPGGGMRSTEEVMAEGQQINEERYPVSGDYSVNSGYFKTLEVPLLAGREFSSTDRSEGLKVAVVNANFAAQFWPGLNLHAVLGKRVKLDPKNPKSEWLTVVGVCAHLLQGPNTPSSLQAANLYRPLSQAPSPDINIGLVGVSDTPASRELLARAVAKADPALALERVYSAEERQRIAYGGEEVRSALSLILGLMTMSLAVSGIYGVTSRAVQLRGLEIAVRRAVGASDGQMMGLLMAQALRLLLCALPLGLLAGALILNQDAASAALLAGGVGGVSVLIGGLVLFSTWLPARQALRRLPSAALNSA
ncbi:putative permease [Paucibacter oligotrophus]|uniref:Putative permease n=1 Tax=Roseateles oligotrophus TaxID=1769250 RepID=A0A840LB47_9BURK|nr:ABC transporter permease [Roseateles oligotrophus]MBB4843933.1 putative permease [Roseateles oligotrophus]